MNVAGQFACRRGVVPSGRKISRRKDNLSLRIWKILLDKEDKNLYQKKAHNKTPKQTNPTSYNNWTVDIIQI